VATKTLPFKGGRDLIPAPGKPILAGGAVVSREDPVRGTEIVLIHRDRYDDWTLPKGKLEVGESIPVCAVREVREETGVTIRLGVPLDTIRYQAGKAGLKKVSYWGGTPVSAVPREPDAEVDEVCWLPVRAAMSRLTYAHDHFLVTQFLEQPVTTPLIIVRHAKAMDRKDWSRKDSARPVNSRGRKQAQQLVPMLSAYGVQRVISSTSTRCVSTIEPFARRHDLRIETYSQLSEEVGADDAKGVSRLTQKVRTSVLQSDQPTVICVHRPVLPHILEALEIPPTTLVTGEFLVAHLTADGEVHALERHRPLA
jgi:8-oxo-dGTP pyrophosphatase MutT (NUDIX family)/phosphohistidine phosphatase SixA